MQDEYRFRNERQIPTGYASIRAMNEVRWHGFSCICTFLYHFFLNTLEGAQYYHQYGHGAAIFLRVWSLWTAYRYESPASCYILFGRVFVFLPVKVLGITVGTRNLGPKDICLLLLQESIANESDEERSSRQTQDYEEIRKSYAELESTYMQFLSDSGLSRSGYWRGSVTQLQEEI